MRLYATVSDAAGTHLGTVYALRSARVARTLSGVGAWHCVAVGSDAAARDLLHLERRVTLFIHDERTGTRRLGGGLLTERSLREATEGLTLHLRGSDDLAQLARLVTLPGTKYDAQALNSLLADLVRVAGWSASTSSTDPITARFDGENVLRAVRALAAFTGLHFRASATTPQTLEFGAFGQPIPQQIVQRTQLSPELNANDDVFLIERVERVAQSGTLCNWIVPLMAGLGEAAVGLQAATRSSPYVPVVVPGPDGRDLVALRDDASIAAYGLVQKVALFKQIAPLSNSDDALTVAANTLYDAAAAYLQRAAHPQTVLKVRLQKVRGVPLQPGDRVYLQYRGRITDERGETVDWRDLSGLFWILEAAEIVSDNGHAVELTLSDVDRLPDDAITGVIGKLDELDIDRGRVQPYFSRDVFTDTFAVDATHPARFYLNLTDAVQAAVRIRLTIKTSPFRATARAVSPGSTETGADATRSLWSGSTDPEIVGDFFWRTVRAYDSVREQIVYMRLPMTIESGDFALMTNFADAPHTHALPDFAIEYGIEDDTQRPDTVSLSLNSVDITATHGGPWGVGGGAVDTTVDITQAIIDAGLQREHRLEIRCAAGQGLVRILVEEYLVIQAVRVS